MASKHRGRQLGEITHEKVEIGNLYLLVVGEDCFNLKFARVDTLSKIALFDR